MNNDYCMLLKLYGLGINVTDGNHLFKKYKKIILKCVFFLWLITKLNNIIISFEMNHYDLNVT